MYALLNSKKELFWFKVPGIASEFNSISIFETRKDARLARKSMYAENLHVIKVKVAVTTEAHVAAQLFADMPQERTA